MKMKEENKNLKLSLVLSFVFVIFLVFQLVRTANQSFEKEQKYQNTIKILEAKAEKDEEIINNQQVRISELKRKVRNNVVLRPSSRFSRTDYYTQSEDKRIAKIANEEGVSPELLIAIRRQEQGKKSFEWGVKYCKGTDYTTQARASAKIIKKVAKMYGDEDQALNPSYDFIKCLGSGKNCSYKGYAESYNVWIKNVWSIYNKKKEGR